MVILAFQIVCFYNSHLFKNRFRALVALCVFFFSFFFSIYRSRFLSKSISTPRSSAVAHVLLICLNYLLPTLKLNFLPQKHNEAVRFLPENFFAVRAKGIVGKNSRDLFITFYTRQCLVWEFLRKRKSKFGCWVHYVPFCSLLLAPNAPIDRPTKKENFLNDLIVLLFFLSFLPKGKTDTEKSLKKWFFCRKTLSD